ncbi:MAG: S-layer homology domain-containing protein [Ruminiclostridium sp.]|nr:S-layer homology domain-containing protein [Ruminiclostridium sp.]
MKKKLLAILVAAALLGGLLGVFAGAQNDTPVVVFDASKGQFTIKGNLIQKNADGVQTYYPDLFPDLKNMMPGDSATQDIKVRVVNASGKHVTLYLKAETTDGQPTVADESPVYTEGKLVYDNNADPTNSDYNVLFAEGNATLTVALPNGETTDGVLDGGVVSLGRFTSNTEKDITVTFALPIEAGNEVAGLVAHLGWVFTAEVTNKKPAEPPALNTEDHYGYIVGYPDGNMKPDGNITRAEVATIFFRLLTDEARDLYWAQTNEYSDVAQTQWFNNAISTLSNAGIINGYEDGSFRPNSPITRAEFAKVAVSFFSYVDREYQGIFPDVPENKWYAKFVEAASELGLITGYEDGTFRPERNITRAEACTIVNRTLDRYPHEEHLLEDMIVWPDNPAPGQPGHQWYYEQVQEATNSHTYDMKTEETSEYEIWRKLLPVRDWPALEKVWSDVNSATGGDVMK